MRRSRSVSRSSLPATSSTSASFIARRPIRGAARSGAAVGARARARADQAQERLLQAGRVTGGRAQRRRRAFGQQPPAVQEPDAIAQQLGLGEVVGREHHRLAAIALGADEVAQETRRQHVQARRRLVEHQHGGIVQHRARDRQPLALAGRQRLAAAIEEPAQLQRARERRDARRRRVAVEAVQAREVPQQLAPGQARVEAGRVGEKAEALPHRQRLARDVEPGDLHPPARRQQDARQDPQRRGLARAVGAEQPVDLAGRDRERQLGDRRGGAEALRERIDRDGWAALMRRAG